MIANTKRKRMTLEGVNLHAQEKKTNLTFKKYRIFIPLEVLPVIVLLNVLLAFLIVIIAVVGRGRTWRGERRKSR